MDGRPILTDDEAESADPALPAFLAHPAGAPVYHGFPLVEETRTPDGWCFGAITDFIDADYGDAFVVAPDGSRAGIVWEAGEGEISEIAAPEEGRWGVFAVWFRAPVRTVEDFTAELHAALPRLREIHARCKGFARSG
jgi:hypothetical protein